MLFWNSWKELSPDSPFELAFAPTFHLTNPAVVGLVLRLVLFCSWAELSTGGNMSGSRRHP